MGAWLDVVRRQDCRQWGLRSAAVFPSRALPSREAPLTAVLALHPPLSAPQTRSWLTCGRSWRRSTALPTTKQRTGPRPAVLGTTVPGSYPHCFGTPSRQTQASARAHCSSGGSQGTSACPPLRRDCVVHRPLSSHSLTPRVILPVPSLINMPRIELPAAITSLSLFPRFHRPAPRRGRVFRCPFVLSCYHIRHWRPTYYE